ncbi:MAG TPA: hypothetical protein VNZ22_16095, partial [Bacillota bacterium]|nr:hypothetical protein [Bacillota bacterium]
STAAAFFSASNYLASVNVTPEAISQFYSNRLANYRIPDRVQVSYVKFGVSNYLGQAESESSKTNLSEMVDANYQRLGTNAATYFPEAKTPADVKARIREQMIRSEAMALARKKAGEFAAPLFDMEPMRAENLQKKAKEAGLPVKTTAPFDREEGPKDIEAGPDFVKAAFRLTPEEPFASPMVGQDGVYVFALDKRIPSEIPPLNQVRDRVVADYKQYQATMLARQAGMAFAQSVTNGLAQGKTFAALCAQANVKAVDLPAFSLSSRSLPEIDERVNINQLKQVAFGTPPGKASTFQPTSEGGMVVFVKAKLPLDQARMKSDLPGFVSNLRRSRQEEAFQDWFRKEADKGLRDTPLARPQQPPAMGATKAAKS